MGVGGDLRDVVKGRPGTFGVYARNLTTGETAEFEAGRVLPTESAAKTFILVHYARLVAAGDCDPTSRVPLTDEHRLLGTGVLRYLAAGLAPTLDDLAWLMIIVSDNVATRMLMESIGGPDDVNETMVGLGLETARLNPTITSRPTQPPGSLPRWQLISGTLRVVPMTSGRPPSGGSANCSTRHGATSRSKPNRPDSYCA